MPNAAIETVVDTNDRPFVRSDRGAHCRWPGWQSRIGDAKLVRSMARKGCSPDNSACEGFFGPEGATVDSLGSLSHVEYRQSLGLAT
jgi:transposase InsO family protein